jgi:hypothetical protein
VSELVEYSGGVWFFLVSVAMCGVKEENEGVVEK